MRPTEIPPVDDLAGRIAPSVADYLRTWMNSQPETVSVVRLRPRTARELTVRLLEIIVSELALECESTEDVNALDEVLRQKLPKILIGALQLTNLLSDALLDRFLGAMASYGCLDLDFEPGGLQFKTKRYQVEEEICAVVARTARKLRSEAFWRVYCVAYYGYLESNTAPRAPQSFPDRAEWLRQQLRVRRLSKRAVYAKGGPTEKTQGRILRGLAVHDGSIESLVKGINEASARGKHPAVSQADVPMS